MERNLQQNFGSFDNKLSTQNGNHELSPLPQSDFTPLFHYQTQIFDLLPKPQQLPEPSRPSSKQRTKLKLSDKTRLLQKLLPSNKKMDIATMLEETYKYVRFLQAQVRAIQSMPLESSFVVQNECDSPCFGGPSGLGMLNRHQLLQVLLNSPSAQTFLYSKGFCVYSFEQLLFFTTLSQPSLFLGN